nr:carboxypeptidase regulatory-like domain-containing protein [Goodfellowiella coeruleoviolacea]
MSAGLDRLVHVLDAPPADLVERVQFAIALENLDVEVARWERAGSFAGVRGDRPGTVTFTVDHLTVMVSFTPTGGRHRIDGWLVPPGQHTVEVRVSDHDSTTTQADDGGRFVLADVPAGTTQILVHLESVHGEPSRTIVTPTLML